MTKKIIIWISMFFLMLLVVGMATAIPVPHTVKGTVFDIDGVSQVSMPTQFFIENLDSGNILYGTVGKGPYTGLYSASLDGYDGDHLQLVFWNKYHNVTFNLTLAGVMHDVDVLINDSFPYDAPVIFSLPSPSVTLPNSYLYDVDAFDVQDVVLTYSLILAPSEMTIDSSGIIQWMPTVAGTYSVVVAVFDSDGLHTNQSFSIIVNEAKRQSRGSSNSRRRFPSGIISLNIVEDEEHQEIDVDNRNDEMKFVESTLQSDSPVSIIDAQLQMSEPEETKKRIIFGLINKLPLFKQLSHGSSSIAIVDAEGNNNNFVSFSLFGAEFYFQVIDVSPRTKITVDAKNNLLSGQLVKQITGLFTRADITLNETLYQEDPDAVVKEIAYYDVRPFPLLKSPEQAVYQYIIDLRERDEPEIMFSVSNSWFKALNISPSQVRLLSYNVGKYAELETDVVLEHEDQIDFIAFKKNKQQRYFVISTSKNNSKQISTSLVKQVEARKITENSVTKLQPFLIEGSAELTDGIPFPEGSHVVVTNHNTNVTIESKTGIANVSGAFSLIVEGKRGDLITVEVSYANNKYIRTINLNGDVRIE